MKHVGYYNGKIGPYEEMTVPMGDRALYFGDGCYDATMFCNGRIFGLEDHLNRFYNSCNLLEIKFHLTREELTAELMRVIDACEEDHGMIYWQASRGTGPRGHQFPPADVKPNLLAFACPCDLVSNDFEGRLITMEDTRFLHCNIKTLNLLPSVIAYQRCIEAECYETVFHRGDIVTECAHSNVLIIKDGVLKSHPRDNLILPGISLKHLLEMAQENGIPTSEEPFTVQELMDADEVIISNSAGYCIRAVEVDGKPVGKKAPELLHTLQQAYVDRFNKECGLA